MRRVVGPIVVMTAASLAASLPSAWGAPTPSRSLERLATGSSSAQALAAEARLRRLEIRALGPGHATEHATVRAKIRRVKTVRRRAGLRPLLPRSSRRPGHRSLAVGDPAEVGRWGQPTSVPVVAVHAIQLPTGKLMLVQQDANGGVAYIYDPATGRGHRADPPANIWCGGQVFLADGRLLFIGGTLQDNGGDNYSGLSRLYIFDPVTEAWTRQVDMRRGRWYPTGTRLPDGRVLITSGWDETGTMTMNGDVEIYTPGGAAGSIQRIADRKTAFYPHWHVLPDGRAFLGGPGQSNSAFFDPSTYAFADQAVLPESRNGYGGGVLLPGPPSGSTKVFLAGGGSTPNTHRFDVLNPSAGWTNGAPLPQTRRNFNTVLLPDGTLLGVGGNGTGAEGLPQRQTLLYSPSANTWTRLADQSEQRAYHSTALLLPDGRVWSGGDNTASGGGNDGDVVEIFEPPYLFRGPRPSIVSAPASQAYGGSFSIQANGSPTRAVLMSPGATTHGNDMNQRHVELAVTPTAGGLSAVAPAHANLAPPGDYMLFVLNADGVPSVARWVRLGGTAPPPPPPPLNQAPTAAFTVSPAKPQTGQQVTFTDASTDSDGSIAVRAWDLDDDGSYDDGAGATASRTFTSAGTFTVGLRVTDDDGAPTTTTRQVTVSATPPPPLALPPPSAPPARRGPALSPGGGAAGPAAAAAPSGPLRLRLSALEGAPGPAPRTVHLRIGASHRVSARFVVVEVGRWARARGRLVVRYRRATATTLRGHAAGVRVHISQRGVYRVRLAFRDGGRLRHAGGVTLIAT